MLLFAYAMGHLLESHLAAAPSAPCSACRPPSNFVRGQASTMWDIVWISPQSQRSLVACPHRLRQALHWPCAVRKWFRRHHWRRGRSNPGCRIAGSPTKKWLTTRADSQSSRHRVVMSSGCMSSHNGCLVDNLSAGVFVMSPCSPQSSWEAALVRSLSTAALRRSAGGSMFARTGNQGNGVGFRVPEIRQFGNYLLICKRSFVIKSTIVAKFDRPHH